MRANARTGDVRAHWEYSFPTFSFAASNAAGTTARAKQIFVILLLFIRAKLYYNDKVSSSINIVYTAHLEI